MTDQRDALVERALELANYIDGDSESSQHNLTSPILRALIARLQTAEALCEFFEPLSNPASTAGIMIAAWRAVRDGEGAK